MERFYLPELDILRFLAFLAVFIYHFPRGSLFFYIKYGALGALGVCGTFGVDLFFALSGYLITKLLLREREATGDISPRLFYIRRILRIWPLYFFYLMFAYGVSRLPAVFISFPPFVHIEFPKVDLCSFILIMTFLINYTTLGFTIITHFWSIGVEEQCYFFWPLVLRYIPRRHFFIVPIGMLVTASAARLTFSFLHFNAQIGANTITRLDPIAMGMVIAMLPEVSPRPAVRAGLLLLGISSWYFAACYCQLPLQDNPGLMAMGYPAVAIGSGAFLLAMIGSGRRGAPGRVRRAMIYLGKISYGLYVYHLVVILGAQVFMFRIGADWVSRAGLPMWTDWLLYFMVAFGTTVLVAAASYRWLEAPFLRLKGRFTAIPSRAV